MSKKLVAYFSATGTTKKAAEKIAEEQGADLYEIRPAVPYTQDELDWSDPSSRTTLEMQDDASRPELADLDCKVKEYDEIWLGFPIWWYTAPHIILNFLESYDFTGISIYPFATSGSSGFGSTGEDLKKSAPGADWHPGKMAR